MLGALLEVSSKEVRLPDYDGFTPLHYAAHNGQEGALEMLLQGEEGDKKMDKQVEKRKAKQQGQEREEVVIIATSAEKIFVLQKATAGWSKLSGGKISPFPLLKVCHKRKIQKFFGESTEILFP